MRKTLSIILLAMVLLVPAYALAAGADGCAPQFRELKAFPAVEMKGQGDLDVVVLTDPLCWHCRLAYKLLSEYPNLYRSEKLLFFPRKSFIGSDMAAWVLEDAAGKDVLKSLVDFAYTELKQPKTEDLIEARLIVLAQFVQAFPALGAGATLPELAARLEREHSVHVLKGAELATKAEMPGTPVLVAGKIVVVGYGPDQWLNALQKKEICE